MASIFQKTIAQNKEYFYALLRIAVGLLFLEHGLQKIFGILGFAHAAPLFSLMGLAGVTELAVGILLTLGLFTRLASLAGIIEMIGVYLVAHAPNGLIPIMNKGELALLYLATFLVLFSHGGQKWCLDNLIAGKGKKSKKHKEE